MMTFLKIFFVINHCLLFTKPVELFFRKSMGRLSKESNIELKRIITVHCWPTDERWSENTNFKMWCTGKRPNNNDNLCQEWIQNVSFIAIVTAKSIKFWYTRKSFLFISVQFNAFYGYFILRRFGYAFLKIWMVGIEPSLFFLFI